MRFPALVLPNRNIECYGLFFAQKENTSLELPCPKCSQPNESEIGQYLCCVYCGNILYNNEGELELVDLNEMV